MAQYIGLMSGTSMDGVDAVLAAIGEDKPLEVLAHLHRDMPAALRDRLMSLNESGSDELHRGALASNDMAALYADAVEGLLAASGVARQDVSAIGAHGQTVRHRPGEFDGTGYTIQLLNGALLAERAGIDVVCDFRSCDVAAGGQGAPLVPAFHAALWSRPGEARAVLNLGGMANLSLLGADGQVGGFDCGPGNVLMDLWSQRHLGQPCDMDGAWAAGGRIDPAWLSRLLDEPYFRRSPPKSTGRDLFHAEWLEARLRAPSAQGLSAQDIQATLAELTARSAAEALLAHAPQTHRLLVCGGGALNGHLMRRLALALPLVDVQSSEASGLPPLQVEAAAFAWLAHAFVHRQPGNRPEVTGARGLRVLGALHPAR
jgi:anhydro-N-acetylmuramic acid kinase